MKVKLGMNASHHHFGTLSSTMREMESEIQPMFRLLSTSGMRSNSRGGSASTGLFATFAAISALPLSLLHQPNERRLPHALRNVRLSRNKLWRSAAYRSSPAS